MPPLPRAGHATDPKAAAYLKPTSEFVSLTGIPTHCVVEGSGPDLLLLHGSGASLHVFDAMAGSLAEQFTVHRLDLPGFGLTGARADRDYRTAPYLDLLNEYADTYLSDTFALAGHSFGGFLAWNYALARPERLSALILMNATGYPEKTLPPALAMARNPFIRPIMRRWGSKSMTRKGLARIVGPESTAISDEVVDRVHTLMSVNGNRAAFVDFAMTDRPAPVDRLGEILVPTLVLTSDLVDGQHFGRDIPASTEVPFPGVGHLMPLEAPEQAATEILTFLRGHNTQETA